MLPADLFVAGLGSFLLAHIAYVVGLNLHGGSAFVLLGAAVAVLTVDVVLARPVFDAVRREHRHLLLPVAAYVVVISAMVTRSTFPIRKLFFFPLTASTSASRN